MNNNVDPTLSNGADKTSISHQWVHHVTQTGIKQEDVLDGYSKWVTHSDYDSVRFSFDRRITFAINEYTERNN